MVLLAHMTHPPFLSGSQHFCASKNVEGQLPELTINAIYDHFRRPGSVRMIMEMADSEVLLDHVADFLVSLHHICIPT